MSDQTAILLVVALAVIFFLLWGFNSRQKRKHEQERLERKRELDKLKADARAAAAEKAPE